MLKHTVVRFDVVEAVASIVRKLNDEYMNGSLVVVEGPHDADALASLGFRGEIFMLCHDGGGISRLVERAVRYRNTILFLDLDSKGRSLTKKACLALQEKRCKFDLFLRRELARACHGRVSHIEELSRFKDVIGGGW